MAVKRKTTSSDESEISVKLWKEGKRLREIAIFVGRTHSFIQRVICNYKSRGFTDGKHRSGRAFKLSEVEERYNIK